MSNFPGCSGVRFLLLGRLVEVADKKGWNCALVCLFFPHFLFTLEAEEMFCNVDALNKILRWRKICSECSFARVRFPFHSLHYFGAIWLFSCNFYSVALLEKCIVIPFIFFLVLMHDKHFCTRISGKDGKTWLQQFFSWPYTVLNCETCMEFVNGKKSFLSIILLLPAFWGSSWRLINLLDREPK